MKVNYFPIYGRAEPIRMLLNHAKAPFEDNKIPMDQWPKIKGDTSRFEFGQMPMVEMENGLKMTQTCAIIRALGQKYGYYSSNPKEAWLIDSTMDYVNETGGLFGAVIFAQGEKKTELLFELLTKQLPDFLKIIEKRVSGKKFLTGEKLSCADFMLGSLLCNTVANENNPNYYAFAHITKSYPAVVSYIENFKAELKDHLAARGPAPF